MSAAKLAIRAEEPADRQAIHALHSAAFGGDGEARLADELRAEGAAVLSLVADEEGVAGHVMYSRLLVDGMDKGASALAPVAVLPARQNRGIGARLIAEAHRRLTARREKIVFVLGDPEYYRRFGFSAATAQPFRTPYDGEYMQALALAPDAPRSGAVTYPAPFARLR